MEGKTVEVISLIPDLATGKRTRINFQNRRTILSSPCPVCLLRKKIESCAFPGTIHDTAAAAAAAATAEGDIRCSWNDCRLLSEISAARRGGAVTEANQPDSYDLSLSVSVTFRPFLCLFDSYSTDGFLTTAQRRRRSGGNHFT